MVEGDDVPLSRRALALKGIGPRPNRSALRVHYHDGCVEEPNDERSRHLRLDRADRARRHHCDGARVPRHATGDHRQESPSSLGAGRQRRRLGHADLRLSPVAARGDLGVRRRADGAGRARGGGAMIVFLLVSYLVILFTLVKLKVVPFNLLWKLSPLVVLLVLTIALFIPMQWGAPQGPLMVVRNSVSIVPDVAGEVIDVPVEANTPLKAGGVLFRIDPTPYESQLGALQAQFKLAEIRLAEVNELQRTGTGRLYDVQQRQAEYDQLKAQVEGAKWNLDKTVVRA